MAENSEHIDVSENPKKRQKVGRKSEVAKLNHLKSHIIGPPCNCSHLKCFEATTDDERSTLISYFNSMKDKDTQDIFLGSLITVSTIARRRPRRELNEQCFHDNAFHYHVNVTRDEVAVKVQVCKNALVSIFGIGKHRLTRIAKSLSSKGYVAANQQRKHSNRPKAHDEHVKESIIEHIKSFKGRRSHYALNATKRLYLPEDLNLRKMYEMYKEQYPQNQVSRESYRKIFTEKSNISFGYPRKDTCSTCDKLDAAATKDDQQKAEHLEKAKVFYTRKAAARNKMKDDRTLCAIAFDFAKNVSCPSISTNDVYYRRQLPVFTFNIHSLGDNKVNLFCYDETFGRKGADDVASMLLKYFNDNIGHEVTDLELFCDSCPGQNKNWTIFRFLHYVVVHKKRFKTVKISFPIRGHSYMECDRDMAIVNFKTRSEIPTDWVNEFRSCRRNPSTYNVNIMEPGMFLNISKHIQLMYRASCPVPTRPIREAVFSQDQPNIFQYRNGWNGPFETAVVGRRSKKPVSNTEEPLLPLYQNRLPISSAKYNDLQVLKQFCRPEAQDFFTNLPHMPSQLGQESEISSNSE